VIADINGRDETLSFSGSGSYYMKFGNNRVAGVDKEKQFFGSGRKALWFANCLVRKQHMLMM
jgi:hypothetical protein